MSTAPLTDSERKERLDRLRTVADEIDRLIRQIAPLAIRLTHLRSEAQMILSEVGSV